MNNYQKELFDRFERFRPKPQWGAYPPYHKGDYLEEYFQKFFERNNPNVQRYFIPVSWSACYINSKDAKQYDLQNELDQLDPSKDYFIVCTHDDAPREILPKNCIVFGAGGNAGGIPIPLICSPLPLSCRSESPRFAHKRLFCSFVGSTTHRVRQQIISSNFNQFKDFSIYGKSWTNDVSTELFDRFVTQTKNSKFSLAPRGYGLTSYRFYEILQLQSVPVYVSDKFWLPWEDELDYSKFSVLVAENEIVVLDLILRNVEKNGEQMIEYAREIYDEYFSLNGVCRKIIERLR